MFISGTGMGDVAKSMPVGGRFVVGEMPYG